MTDQQRSIVTAHVVEAVRSDGETPDLQKIIIDALLKAGVDLAKEPSLEETKCLLVEAALAAKGALSAR